MSGFIKFWAQRFVVRVRGEKFYRTGFQVGSQARYLRRRFRTATEASMYGLKVKMRVERMGRGV